MKAREELGALRAARAASADEQTRRHHAYGYVRLGIGGVLAYTGWLALANPETTPWAFLWTLAVFFGVSTLHAKAIRKMEIAQRAVRYYDRSLARLDGDYSGAKSNGAAFADAHHPFSGDLDLFGAGGLFERLSQARTREGEATLAGWLLTQAGPPEAESRMNAASELAGRVELRERLAVLGSEVEAGLHPAALRRWALESSDLFPAAEKWMWAAAVVSAACVAAAVAIMALSPVFVAMLFAAGIFGLHQRAVVHTLHETSDAGRDLRVLEGVLRLLEEGQFTSSRLTGLQATIRHEDGPRASERIARLAHLAEWIDSLDNQLFRVLDFLFLFSLHFAKAADAWRRANGGMVETWLRAAGEFEALASLAAWEYENPDTVRPEWTAEACVDGTALRHPLLPRSRVVANDARLGEPCRLLMVSGSNMSGKSTYLRTLGLNVVLAHAGARVCAERLRLGPLTLGASIRTVDSLQEGASRFYAELQRLKAIVDLSRGERRLLFLFDELLSGTNSHDRRIGAAGIVTKLLETGAIGVVTTHDLALAEIGAGGVVNVHFEDTIAEGRIQFDYRMKPGVVKTSNALALMRSIGLEVAG